MGRLKGPLRDIKINALGTWGRGRNFGKSVDVPLSDVLQRQRATVLVEKREDLPAHRALVNLGTLRTRHMVSVDHPD